MALNVAQFIGRGGSKMSKLEELFNSETQDTKRRDAFVKVVNRLIARYDDKKSFAPRSKIANGLVQFSITLRAVGALKIGDRDVFYVDENQYREFLEAVRADLIAGSLDDVVNAL